jgi:predicted  nucleic acid-binding Zn ribbon protein
MAKDERQVAEAVDKVLDKVIKRVETWWVAETAREAKKAEQAEARAAAKAARTAAKEKAKAEVGRATAVHVYCTWFKVGGTGVKAGCTPACVVCALWSAFDPFDPLVLCGAHFLCTACRLLARVSLKQPPRLPTAPPSLQEDLTLPITAE